MPTYTDESMHEGLRKKLEEGWEPLQVIPVTTASRWWLIFTKEAETGLGFSPSFHLTRS